MEKFAQMKNKKKELRKTADVAALFVSYSNEDICGASYFGITKYFKNWPF